VSGWMDTQSALLANQLLGNVPYSPIIECLGSGGEFVFHEWLWITCTGAKANVLLDAEPIQMNRVLQVNPGQTLYIGAFTEGHVLYLGIAGNIFSKQVLGSQSPLQGIHPKRLEKGMTVIGEWKKSVHPSTSHLIPNRNYAAINIPVVPGPEYDWLSEAQKQTFLQLFTISKWSDRMAYLLEGDLIIADIQRNMRTSAVMPGVVQWLPSGRFMILMRDCQTTGGYPRVAILDEVGINLVAQKPPGSQIRFEILTQE